MAQEPTEISAWADVYQAPSFRQEPGFEDISDGLLFAEKLNVEVVTVERGVQGLMYLLTECSKLMVRNDQAASAWWAA